jgi:hypothetical protein
MTSVFPSYSSNIGLKGNSETMKAVDATVETETVFHQQKSYAVAGADGN